MYLSRCRTLSYFLPITFPSRLPPWLLYLKPFTRLPFFPSLCLPLVLFKAPLGGYPGLSALSRMLPGFSSWLLPYPFNVLPRLEYSREDICSWTGSRDESGIKRFRGSFEIVMRRNFIHGRLDSKIG